jgi:hypothetical protein
MAGEMAVYGLSGMIVLLGGVSLVLQKVYKVDSTTGEKTIIEVPIFGKLSTNYPAIAFVFIGAAVAAYTLTKTWEAEDSWVITGSFRAPTEETITWERGNLRLSPKKFHMSISRDGNFEIEGEIRKGLRFEEVVKQITYENCTCDGKIFGTSIMVETEYNKFMSEKDTLLKNAEKNTRTYKTIEVNVAGRQVP